MPPKVQKSKEQKAKAAASSSKGKKKKWSKGKVRDKLANAVLFDKATYDKMQTDVTKYKLITPSIVGDRLRIRLSLAKKALREMESKGLIKKVDTHSAQMIYTKI